MTADDMNSSNPMPAPFWKSRLPAKIKLVGLRLAHLAEVTGQDMVRTTVGTPAEDCGLTEAAVRDALTALDQVGAIAMEEAADGVTMVLVSWGRRWA